MTRKGFLASIVGAFFGAKVKTPVVSATVKLPPLRGGLYISRAMSDRLQSKFRFREVAENDRIPGISVSGKKVIFHYTTKVAG